MRSSAFLFLILVLHLTSHADPPAADAAADEKNQAPAAVQPGTPQLLTVKTAPFQVTVQLKGTFAPENATPIVLQPEIWADFVIVRIADHGVRVKTGDVIVRFNAEDLQRQIADLETKVAIDTLNIAKARHQLSYMKDAFALQRKTAERDFEIAEQWQGITIDSTTGPGR